MNERGSRRPITSLRSVEFRDEHRFLIRIRSENRKTRAGACFRVYGPLERRPIDGVA
jgi:hypothetical protein